MKCIYCFFLPLISFSQTPPYLNYNYSATFGNHVIAVYSDTSYEFYEGDIIGCFFINSDLDWQCCGSSVYTNGVAFVSAWPDDPVTDYEEGFMDGDYIMIALRLCDGNDYTEGNTMECDVSGSQTYSTNGISYIDVWLADPPDCSNIDLNESLSQSKKILKITDLSGRLTDKVFPNQPLIILYDDGFVEKKLINR